MLVCPQCQFENPDNNKFCQKCGTSLTEKICPACEALVAFDAESCPKCGEPTGTVWRAIVALDRKAQPELVPSQPLEPTAPLSPAPLSSDDATIEDATMAAAGKYLDPQQRYKLLTPLPGQPSSPSADIEVSVLDCQPFQPSLVGTLEHQQLDALDLIETNEPVFVPALAEPYLELQQQLYPALPQIHDAWQQNGQVVILLQDRSTFPLLLDVWSDEDVLPIQILHWLHELTELWALLHPQGFAQSLLELNNLHVDEDQLLCLQRLYPDHDDKLLGLRDLGRLWQLLFQRSQRTQLGSLAQLCHALESGEIRSLETLRSRLEAVVDEFQPDMPMTQPAALDPAIAGLEGNPMAEPDREPSSAPLDISSTASPTLLEMAEPDEDAAGEGDDAPTVVLPMKLLSLEDAGRTDIGRQREHNEDYFCIHTQVKKLETPVGRTLEAKGLYILCDGMGGHAGGEVASALAVDTLRRYFEANWKDQLPKEESIREAIQQANQAIYDLNQQNARSGSGRMGTTVVLVLVHNTEAAIAHVGDSRLYRFSRRRGLEQVTSDHEVGQREIQRGVEPAIAYARPDAYQLTQALGPRDENFINPDVEFLELNEDLLLLLCSDGLTDNDLLETHWRTHIEPLLSSQTSLEQGATQLIELANHYNGHDNITAVLLRAKVRPNLEMLKLR
jgi:protein phosphatase